jgi:DNA helicase INO80
MCCQTVQSISVLAYLIERHDIWGPFLVIAPASTLFNWQQELARFVPEVKALPYWGNPKERALLRKFWSKKEISYNEDAPFNVLITSYQMASRLELTLFRFCRLTIYHSHRLCKMLNTFNGSNGST